MISDWGLFGHDLHVCLFPDGLLERKDGRLIVPLQHDLLVECPGEAEYLEPDALPWREGRVGDREPELLPGSLRCISLVLTGPSTISAPDSAALVSC